MHQIQQCAQRALRRALVRPHRDLGCEDVHPVLLGHPRGGDPVKVPDGDQIEAAFPLIGGNQGARRSPVTATVEHEAIGDHVDQQFLNVGGYAHLTVRAQT